MRAYGRAQWVLVRLGFQVVEVWADHSVSTLSQASRVKCPMAYGGEDDDGHHKRLFNENLGLCTVSPCNSSLLCPKLPTRLCSIFSRILFI